MWDSRFAPHKSGRWPPGLTHCSRAVSGQLPVINLYLPGSFLALSVMGLHAQSQHDWWENPSRAQQEIQKDTGEYSCNPKIMHYLCIWYTLDALLIDHYYGVCDKLRAGHQKHSWIIEVDQNVSWIIEEFSGTKSFCHKLSVRITRVSCCVTDGRSLWMRNVVLYFLATTPTLLHHS